MRNYKVLDPNLRTVALGDSVFPVNDGSISLPAEIAQELIATGQIAEIKETPVEAEAPAKKAGSKAKKDQAQE